MVYRGLDALTQIVSSSNSSFVKYVGYWQQNTTEDSFDIAHPSSPASVAFTFNGTQAGVFGIVSLNGYPLLGSIAGASGSSVNVAEKQPYSGYHSDHHSEQDWDPFYVTNTLPCDQYTLNLTVGHEQVMQVHQFKFAPCLPVSGNLTSASVSAPLSAVSADSISNIGSSSISSSTSTPSMLAAASRTGAGKPLSAALIATLALSSLLVFFALVGGLVLLLRLRRQRQRKRQRSRSHSQTHSRSRFRFRSLFRPRTWLRLPGHRPKLSPSAQYLASVVDTGSGGGGGDAGLLGPPGSMAKFRSMSASASASRAALLVPFQVTVESSSSPWLEVQGVEKRPPPPPQALDHSNGSVDGGRVVRGYLSDSKGSQVHQHQLGGGVLGPPSTPNSVRSDPPQYEFRTSP